MVDYSDDMRAWGYTQGAARLLGVSLSAAVIEGWLGRDELGEMVQTCAACAQGGPCTDFQAHSAQAEALPADCPNKSVIEALRP